MRILALVPGGISDQILFFPTLEDLKTKYPKAAIDVVVEPRAKGAYRVCPHVNEVLLFDYRDRNGLADYLNLLGIIRDREYEIVFCLAQPWAIWSLLWLNGIPTRIGYQGENTWLMTNAVPQKTQQYTAYMYHDLLSGIGINSPCPDLTVFLPKEDINWAQAQQESLGIKDSGYIVIYDGSATSRETNGSYPVPQWQQITDQIREKQPDIPIVLLQDPEDSEWIIAMREGRPDLKIITASDVGKLAAIVAGANLMLCTKGTPLHLGVAVGTPLIALLASQEASQLLPPQQDNYIALESRTDNLADIKAENVLETLWNR